MENMNRFGSFLISVIRLTVLGIITLIPVFFLPLFANYYDTAKIILLGFLTAILLLLWSLHTAISRTVSFSMYPKVLAIFGLFLTASISTLIISPNKFDALVSPAGPGVFFCLFILTFIGSISADESFGKSVIWGLIGMGSIISLITIYMFFGIGLLMFPDAAFMKDTGWTPIGSSIAMLTLLISLAPLAISETVKGFRVNNDLMIALGLVASALMASAAVITAISVIPALTTTMMPMATSWSVLLDVYKNIKFAFFGVGPENYLGAFTSARPAALNAGPLWNARFLYSGNVIFHFGTIYGLMGLVATLLFLRPLASGIRITSNYGLKIAYGIIILSFFLTPFHISIFVTAIGLLLLSINDGTTTTRSWRIPDHIGWVAYAFSLLGLVLSGIIFYLTGRYYLSEYTFRKSLDAAQANNGGLTYNLQIKSIQLNPYNSSFRIAYAQTNLALANSIANSIQATQSGKQISMSDTDRQTISQLIQQAIREAKIATQLGPNNINTWEILARVYASITNIVQGADQWAIASYQRAIQLDPTNTNHRLNLAGIYISKNDLDNAVIQLQAALVLKPDAAVTYYNLAYVFGLRKEYVKQASALKQTLTLLPTDSADAKRVTEELEKIMKSLSPQELAVLEGNPPQGTPNQPPLPVANPTPEPIITPKLELTEEASPSVELPTEPARL
jgi:tetratricopeptide (TPR) repeat protein